MIHSEVSFPCSFRRLKVVRLALPAVVLLCLLAGRTAAASEEAVRPVEALHTVLSDVMGRADELGYAGRFEQLEPVIRDSFDLAAITRLAAGTHWRRLEDAEQERLTDRFSEYVVSTYADRFSDYTGQDFAMLGRESMREGLELVRTRIERPRQDPVVLNYVVSDRGESWRIVDIHLRGDVSQVSVWRSEFGSILSGEGLEQLLAQLAERIDGHRE